LISRINIPDSNVYIPFDSENFIQYKENVLRYFKENRKNSFDVIYLGMDKDGNTGRFNYIPKEGSSILEEKNCFGFSADFIKVSSKIIFLIEKEDKREIFEKAVIRKGNYPINFIRNKNTVYLLDFWV
jgi:6-phosphogluconolactonase/glucosamine-6-phosphate isomerase/deaminase